VLQHVAVCVAVCCSVLQCIAVCCSVLQRVVVCCSVLRCVAACCSAPRYLGKVRRCVAAAWCSVLQRVAVCVASCCNALQHVAVCQCTFVRSVGVMQCVAVCCSVCCSVLQYFAEYCSVSLCVAVNFFFLYLCEVRGNEAERLRVDEGYESDCVVACCNVLQRVAVCCSVLQSVAVHYDTLMTSVAIKPDMHALMQSTRLTMLQHVAACCRVLQRVAACCSVLQCVAVHYDTLVRSVAMKPDVHMLIKSK